METRILVVDDDRHMCDLLAELFRPEGWGTEAALSAAEAVGLFQYRPYDLVICDIQLGPGQNGLELYRRFRTYCPVILLTGLPTAEIVAAVNREGAPELIQKPFKAADILNAVRRVLNRPGQSEP